MKKIITLLCLTFFLHMPAAFALGYMNQQAGFNGAEWGDSPSKVKSRNIALTFVRSIAEKSEDIYVEQNASKKLYDMEFDNITWHFVDNKLFMVRAVINNDKYIYDSRLTHGVERMHGKAMQAMDNLHQKTATLLWLGDKTYIRIFSDYKNKRTVLSLYNDRLHLLWQSKGKFKK